MEKNMQSTTKDDDGNLESMFYDNNDQRRAIDKMSEFSAFQDESQELEFLEHGEGNVNQNQLNMHNHNLHGRSQSSFRSYTNHHMGSGSNHCLSDNLNEEDEIIDCDTCLDRQESSNNQRQTHRTSTINNLKSLRKDRGDVNDG